MLVDLHANSGNPSVEYHVLDMPRKPVSIFTPRVTDPLTASWALDRVLLGSKYYVGTEWEILPCSSQNI